MNQSLFFYILEYLFYDYYQKHEEKQVKDGGFPDIDSGPKY